MMLRVLYLTALLLGTAVLASAAVRWGEINKQSTQWYAGEEARAIAASIVQYQTPDGGWPKNTDMTQPPSAAFLADTHFDHRAATIDNDATYTQLRYLARVIAAKGDPAWRAAFDRGLDYLLAAQYPNGGWPQYFPLRPGYYTHITYNDNAMINVLTLLREVSQGQGPYAFVDSARRAQAGVAVEKGIACILRTQVRQGGRLTAWCAQHDENTFEPAWARNFEPPSLSGAESVGVVRFLMDIGQPAPEVIAAVEGAVAWFQAVPIHGLRVDETPGADGKKDRHAVADPAAPDLWARFCELGTNKPIYIGRDKVIRYDFNEIERERRTGYNYLGMWPAALLAKDYPHWRIKQVTREMLTEKSIVEEPICIYPPLKPDVIVAADGSGQYTSLQEAISAAPMRTDPGAPRWVIFVKAGTYQERIYVQRERGNIHVLGEDQGHTVVTYNLSASLPGPDGKPIGTFRTPTVQIDGDGMIWENITLANTAGEPGPRPAGPAVAQALALRADGDRLVFRHCRFLGWQDTILVNRGRHYFEDCYIEGHVDFIFGAATAYFNRCHIHVLKDGYITAASTPKDQPYGYVFADCTITGVQGVKTYLGRPWRDFAKTVFLRTEMSEVVRAEGWHNWNKPLAEQTTFYAEFGSTGPGASPTTRVKWTKPLAAEAATALTPVRVLGAADGWNPENSVTAPASGGMQRDIEYGQAGGEKLLLDVSVPAGDGPHPVAILVHGGGWSRGDKFRVPSGDSADITPMFAPLTAAGFTWFSINYRHAPQHRWPACFEDVQTAIRWVKAHAAEFRGDPARIALFGHSAGGHLVCLAATLVDDSVRVQAVVGYAPVTNHEQDLPVRGGLSPSLQNLLNRPKALTPESLGLLRAISPLNQVRPGLPPFLLIHGEADKTVPIQQSLDFQAKLRANDDTCDLLVLRGAGHGLADWDRIDPDYPAHMVAWLGQHLQPERQPAPVLQAP